LIPALALAQGFFAAASTFARVAMIVSPLAEPTAADLHFPSYPSRPAACHPMTVLQLTHPRRGSSDDDQLR
jgi:hypothetical protein